MADVTREPFDAKFSLSVGAFFTDHDTNIRLETGTGYELMNTARIDVWDRTQNPQPREDRTGPEKDDYRLLVGVGFDF